MTDIYSSALQNVVNIRDGVAHVNASGLHYRNLNKMLRSLGNPERLIRVENVYGQRYIGTDLSHEVELHVYGTPGNDLAAFLDGSTVVVHGNAQDGVGNTMNNGTVIVHGRAGDIVGHSMRGGEIYVRDDVGYRCGIHMKEYESQRPTIVVGGTAQDYLGEYMAGGTLIVLGLTLGPSPIHTAKFIGTGMHGGVIYIRGKVQHLDREVEARPPNESDFNKFESSVKTFCNYFNIPPEPILNTEFTKLAPASNRPYGKLYTY